ncbi:MAG: GNAT family N-acetyltransferase [Pseudomonadota bacterium]
MRDNLFIRPLIAEDKKAWFSMWKEYVASSEVTTSNEVCEILYDRLLSGDLRECKCLIAEMSGKPVGLAHYLYHRNTLTVEDTCYMIDLFVESDLRGKGVGRALVEMVHTTAKQNGIPSTYWETKDSNQNGRRLYEKIATKIPYIMYQKED